MPDKSEVDKLLSQVVFLARNQSFDGLDALRHAVERDPDGGVVAYVRERLWDFEGKVRGGIAFVLAGNYRERGDLAAIRDIYAEGDADVKQSVLNALWGEPNASPEMGPGIVALAIEGAGSPDGGVRTETCYVLQNQCAWGVDVSDALEPLLRLLDDSEWRVRHQASYAVGNVAKRKYDLNPHLLPLTRNLSHENIQVRVAAAWAVRQLSRRCNIAPAIPSLARLLALDGDYNKPRIYSAGALLHHARKSSENLCAVRTAVAAAHPNSEHKEVARFLKQLAQAL